MTCNLYLLLRIRAFLSGNYALSNISDSIPEINGVFTLPPPYWPCLFAPYTSFGLSASVVSSPVFQFEIPIYLLTPRQDLKPRLNMVSGEGGYRQINKALNICVFEDYLKAQQKCLSNLLDVEQISPRVIRILGQNPGKVSRNCRELDIPRFTYKISI